MDTTTTPVAGQPDAKVLGGVARLLSKVLPRLTAEERGDLIKDAAAMSQTELDKAGDSLLTGIEHVRDAWDGLVTTVPPTNEAHGPGSSAPPGTINIGPQQQASGAGAPKMEREYSDHSPQHGIEAVAERLGAKLQAHGMAVKALYEAVKHQSTQLALVQSGMGDAVNKAIADLQLEDAVRQEVRKAVRKALADSSDSNEPTGDDALTKALSEVYKADKEDDDERNPFERKKEAEEEGDDKEEAKSLRAADWRLTAKNRLDEASECIDKAKGFIALEQYDVAKAYRKAAKIHLEKAQTALFASASLRDGNSGPSSQAIAKKLNKLRKARRDCAPQNQDKWPNKGGVAGKSDSIEQPAAAEQEPATGKAEPAPVASSPDLKKAIEQLEAAARGTGMLNANMQQLFDTITGKSNVIDTETGTRLPPVFALAKSTSGIATVEHELDEARNTGVISSDEFDKAREALMWARMNLPEETVTAKIARLGEPAREILNRQRAA